jgi:hypothetical protein
VNSLDQRFPQPASLRNTGGEGFGSKQGSTSMLQTQNVKNVPSGGSVATDSQIGEAISDAYSNDFDQAIESIAPTVPDNKKNNTDFFNNQFDNPRASDGESQPNSVGLGFEDNYDDDMF